MANAIAFVPTSMPDLTVWYGFLSEASDTTIIIEDGTRRSEYIGSFSYSIFGSVSGVLETVNYYVNGVQQYSVTNIGADAGAFYNAVQIQGDFELAASIVLAGDDVGTGSSGDDRVSSFGGNDTLFGGSGADQLMGGEGNDSLLGQFGNDELLGQAGDDDLLGGEGVDTLEGGAGDDVLFGGEDTDVFRFSGQIDQDRIEDFDHASEVLEISIEYGFSSIEDVLDAQTRPSAGVTRLTLGENQWVDILDAASGTVLSEENIRFFNPNETDTVREGTDTSATLPVGAVRLGIIDAEPILGDGPADRPALDDGQGGRVDKDWYRVTLEADRTYQFRAESINMTTESVFARLYDAAGNAVGAGTDAEGEDAIFTFETSGQTGALDYYLAVSAGDTNNSDFLTATGRFLVSLFDLGATADDTVAANVDTNAAIEVDTTISGEIQQFDIGGNYFDADYYRVSLEGGLQYRITANANPGAVTDNLDELFIRIRDADGAPIFPDLSDEGAAPEILFDAPGNGARDFFIAVSAGGSGAWWSKTGSYSLSIASEGTAPPTNYRPTAEAANFVGDPGDVVSLMDLFSYSDPDGPSDITSFAVQDRTREGGNLTYQGQVMDPNVVYERPIGEIGDWAFVVGPPGTDYIGFNAIDSAGAFNTSVVSSVSAAQLQAPVPLASAEDLFGQQKLSVLADFAYAAYFANENATDALASDGWVLLNTENILSDDPNEMWLTPAGTNFRDTSMLGYVEGDHYFNGNSSALVARSPDGGTLIVSFTGTNEYWDAIPDWYFMGNHYSGFLQLFEALGLDDGTHGYDEIFVTGHSLGAAMAQAFKQHNHDDDSVIGVGFANPGLVAVSFTPYPFFGGGHLNNFTSITLDADPIRFPGVLTDQEGDQILIGSSSTLAQNVESLHAMSLYQDIAIFLEERGVDLFGLQSNGFEDNRTYHYTPYGEVFVGGEGATFSVAGSPNGVLVTPDSITTIASPSPLSLDFWTFSTEEDDSSILTIDASAFTNTDWTVSADGGEVVLTNAAMQELLRFDDFGSFQVNSSWADLDLDLGPYEGTDILPDTVYVSSGAGDDNIDGSSTDRRIVVTTGDGDDVVRGGFPNDLLDGEGGNDTLYGNGGNDELHGGADNDRLIGGEGADSLNGDDGNDVLIDRSLDTNVVNGGLGEDRVVTGGGDDVVSGGEDRDVIKTFGGDDEIYGDDGNDVILSGTENDTVFGGDGDDVIKTSTGDDYVDAGDGNDIIFTWRGDDTAIGGAGDDTIRGDFDDDIIEGGSGNDRLVGAPGRDTFIFRDGFEEDRILDFRNGSDLLDFSNHTGVSGIGDLSISQVSTNVVITDGAGGRVVLADTDILDIGAEDFVFEV